MRTPIQLVTVRWISLKQQQNPKFLGHPNWIGAASFLPGISLVFIVGSLPKRGIFFCSRILYKSMSEVSEKQEN